MDSLYVGLHVTWGDDWPVVLKHLEENKQKAYGSDGLLEESTPGRNYLFLPGGMPPNYRYHLKFCEYNLFIAKTDTAKNSPNAYLQITSETLWKRGMEYALDLVVGDLRYLGGKLEKIVPSRLDICADFRVKPGLTLPFLQSHAVCRSRDLSSHMNSQTLETCYFGSASAPIRLRIYDKGKEVLKKGEKLWFADLWGTDDLSDIWRVEFQLRREALKQLGVDHIGDIWRKLGGIWRYLTEDWFSLRLPDNGRQNRREMHPWWREVMACANRLGQNKEVRREFRKDSEASTQWYIAHIAGCLPAFAAHLNVNNYQEAILQLGRRLYRYWEKKDFESEFLKKAIKLGKALDQKGDGDDRQ
jgi:hypothetical protein